MRRAAPGGSLEWAGFLRDLRSEEAIDMEDVTEQSFINPAGNIVPVTQPLMKAAAMVLSEAYPAR